MNRNRSITSVLLAVILAILLSVWVLPSSAEPLSAQSPLPTATSTPLPPTATSTPLPPTPTLLPPTATPTLLPPTATPLPPTATATPLPPTATPTPLPPTATPLPPTATATPLPPTATPTPLPPTATPLPPTATATPLPPTATPTPLPPTPTFTPVPPLCNIILDDFDRAGAGIGANWLGSSSVGHYRIQSNQVRVLSGGPIYWKQQAFGADQQACVALTMLGKKSLHGVMLKVQATEHDQPQRTEGFISVSYAHHTRSGSVVSITTYVPGQGWRTLATYAVELQNGDVLAGRARADGAVEAYVNGVAIGSADAGPFFVDKGGSIGLWFRGRGRPLTRLDNFGGQ